MPNVKSHQKMRQGRIKLHEIVEHLLTKVEATKTSISSKNSLDKNFQNAWEIFEEKFPYYEEFAPFVQLKDQNLSDKLKEAGNKSFSKEKDYEEAIRYYTSAIRVAKNPFASEGRQFIATCLSNLSAVYLEQKRWRDVIKATSTAKNFCPNVKETIKKKLIFRESKAKAKIDNLDDLFDDDESETQKLATGPELDQLNQGLKNLGIGETKFAKKLPKFDETPFISNENFPNCSDKLELKNHPEKGRYMVANQNIPAGEIIMIEKTNIQVVDPSMTSKRCYNCLALCVSPIPCRCCRTVCYCSVVCEEKSWGENGHDIECAYMASLVRSNTFQTVLRIILLGLKENPEMFLKEKDNPICAQEHSCKKKNGVNGKKQSKPFAMNYESILKGHFDLDVLPHDALTAFIYFSIALTRLLIQKEAIDPETQDIKKISKFIFKHATVVQLNSISIQRSKFYEDNNKLEDYEMVAAGYFPTVALTNHSCATNTAMFFKGATCFLITVRRILAGEEVTNNYGPLFSENDKKERKEHLKSQYNFTCNCQACFENWGKTHQFKGLRYLRCPACFQTQTTPLDRADYQICEFQG